MSSIANISSISGYTLDSLTKLCSRQALQHLILEHKSTVSMDMPLTFALFHIKNMKLYNKHCGNHHGDLIIRAVAKIIKQNLPEYAVAGRWNGNVIGVVLPFSAPVIMMPWASIVENSIRQIALPLDWPQHLQKIETQWTMASTPPNAIENLATQVENQLDDIKWESMLNPQTIFNSTNSNLIKQNIILTLLNSKSPFLREQTIANIYYGEAIAKSLGLSPEQQETIREAALWQDVGLLNIPIHKLLKPHPISLEDKEHIEKHVDFSLKIAKTCGVKDNIMEIIAAHHENWDGSGYPNKLQGAAIPLEAQILGLTSYWASLLQTSGPSKCVNTKEAAEQLTAVKDTWFRQELVETMLAICDSLPTPDRFHSIV